MRDLKYPIYFYTATCVYCGADNSIEPINKFGQPAKKTDIFPIHKMKCKTCGREFFIRWMDMDDENHTAKPVAISKNVIDDFIKEVEDELAKETSAAPYDRYEVTDFGTF